MELLFTIWIITGILNGLIFSYLAMRPLSDKKTIYVGDIGEVLFGFIMGFVFGPVGFAAVLIVIPAGIVISYFQDNKNKKVWTFE